MFELVDGVKCSRRERCFRLSKHFVTHLEEQGLAEDMAFTEIVSCARIKMQTIFKDKELSYFSVHAGNEEFLLACCISVRAVAEEVESHANRLYDPAELQSDALIAAADVVVNKTHIAASMCLRRAAVPLCSRCTILLPEPCGAYAHQHYPTKQDKTQPVLFMWSCNLTPCCKQEAWYWVKLQYLYDESCESDDCHRGVWVRHWRTLCRTCATCWPIIFIASVCTERR